MTNKQHNRILIEIIVMVAMVFTVIGAFIGSRNVKGYDVNLMHYRMEHNNQYNYCPYCGERLEDG